MKNKKLSAAHKNAKRQKLQCTYQVICAEKSFISDWVGQILTKIPWIILPLLDVWKAQFQGKVEMKYRQVLGCGSENVIIFNF